jgi:PAS domain S-box-containing protein
MKIPSGLKGLLDIVPDMVCFAGSDGYFKYLNHEWEKVLGYTVEELLSRPLFEFIHPEDLEGTRKEIERQLKGEMILDFENRYRSKDGSYKILQWRATPAEGRTLFAVARDITERKRAEEVLRESEEKYRFLAENMFDIVWTVDRDFRTTFVSPSIEYVLGFTVEERKAQALEEMITPESLQHIQMMLLQELERDKDGVSDPGRSVSIEVEYYRKDGSTVWMENRVKALRDRAGEIVGMHGISMDITERKKAEETLREREERLKTIIEANKDAMIVINNKGSITLFNPAAEKMFDRRAADILGQSVSCLMPDAYRSQHTKDVESFFSTGLPNSVIGQTIEVPAERASGEEFPIEITLSWGGSGEKAFVVGVIREITERKMAEEELKNSEMRFRNLIEGSIQGILIHRNHKPLFVNQTWASIHGYAPKEILMMDSVLPLIAPADRERMVEYKEARMRGEHAPSNYEYHGIRKDGSRVWLENRAMTVMWDGEPAVQTIIIDITKRKQLESQLRQSQKLESIGNLAGGIAHDFNNILSSIIGYTELALDEAEKGSPLEDNLQEVYTAGKRARDLVKQILAFARQSNEERKPIQVDTIAKEALKLIRSTTPATIEIRENIESRSLIFGNPSQVHQLFLNLCTNAAQAMEDTGGILEVGLTDVEQNDRSPLPELGLKSGDYIKLAVSDTGPGIAPDIIDHIFEPYFTTKGVGEGTGMGLALAHGIVESYGGKIAVDSELGKGTVFSIYLPTTKSREDYRPYAEEKLPAGNERILFVDDELPIAKMGGKLLEGLGYRVTVRTASVEALELFRAKPDDFDLVITDMTMPNITGDELAMELIAVRSDIPIILCTGYSKKMADETAAMIGIKAFAYKPIVKADLAKTVRNVLNKARKVAD